MRLPRDRFVALGLVPAAIAAAAVTLLLLGPLSRWHGRWTAADGTLLCAWLIPHIYLALDGLREVRLDPQRRGLGFPIAFFGPTAGLALVLVALAGIPSWLGRAALLLTAAWAWFGVRVMIGYSVG